MGLTILFFYIEYSLGVIMHKSHYQLQDHKKRSLLLHILFCLDTLLLIISFALALHDHSDSRSLLLLFLAIDIMLIIYTAIFAYKNLLIVHKLEDYLFQISHGTDRIRLEQFNKMLDDNQVDYQFQPILNARTGDIFAYEALMTYQSDLLEFTSTEILDLATRENRLYDIEKLTLHNNMEIIRHQPDNFRTKMLFINCVLNYHLTEEDFSKLFTTFGSLFEKAVIQLNEITYMSETSMEVLKERFQKMKCQFSYSDYGTDETDVIDLINSCANYIKIDRSITSFIDLNTKKQHQLYNIINFARLKNIKTIATGIERYEELEYIINLDIDYVQGDFLAKADNSLATTISEEIFDSIQKLNYKKILALTNHKIYETKGDSILDPYTFSSKSYSIILIKEEKITFTSSSNKYAKISLVVPDNQKCEITLDNLMICGIDRPCLIIGTNSSVTLRLIGNNNFSNDGIRVVEQSDLQVIGDGNLTIHADRNGRTGIGGSDAQTYGNITLAGEGTIKVISSSNLSVGIGGGRNSANSTIRLFSGTIIVNANGYQTLGIGSLMGNAKIYIGAANIDIKTEGTKTVGIGSIIGSADITTLGNINIECNGKISTAIGSIEESDGLIHIKGGDLSLSINARIGTGVGAIQGKYTICQQDGNLTVSGEGYELIGLGDHFSMSYIKIKGGLLAVRIVASPNNTILNMPRHIIIDGGNIQCDFPEGTIPVNSHGTLLTAHLITNMDEFVQSIETISYKYIYRAVYSELYPFIKVYLPENSIIG
jgi:EAL domain-containing protein (putative c-di-GMP-specific phosphodiesterase class I)